MFFKTKMGMRFFEGTMPQIANALEKLVKIADKFMKETDEAEDIKDLSQFKDPIVSLKIPDTDITALVTLEGEGVRIEAFKGHLCSTKIASVWKLYDEMEAGEEAHDESA